MRNSSGRSYHIVIRCIVLALIPSATVFIRSGASKEYLEPDTLDERVSSFLESRKGRWYDWNVPYSDSKILHDLILKNNYTQALEIGTSTGLSAIWIAWALSKTGGKLITIEIDEGRYQKALANFEEAGLSDYIDARLADAREMVEILNGPFDFVFSDADKNWYTNYFIALAPKLEIGGCYTAHNVRNTGIRGISEFVKYVKGRPDFKTLIDTTSRAGISISFKVKN